MTKAQIAVSLLALSFAASSYAGPAEREGKSTLFGNEPVGSHVEADASRQTCKMIPKPGSRLKEERCMTRAQWASLRQIVRFDLQPAHWIR